MDHVAAELTSLNMQSGGVLGNWRGKEGGRNTSRGTKRVGSSAEDALCQCVPYGSHFMHQRIPNSSFPSSSRSRRRRCGGEHRGGCNKCKTRRFGNSNLYVGVRRVRKLLVR
ncbi:hypothetical protein PanWU01x14_027360 [Parasponia andersonii]|uniref:Uncharacterized protein n=1 Tax=Parasponia andersonii TaxID=3476 RepID=A0A2P5DWC2_PARAD|nr:hypothetical protein PanWU01x14_027360 [Parasponia andersonii]